jgi:hypothetical protein
VKDQPQKVGAANRFKKSKRNSIDYNQPLASAVII